MTSRWQKFKKGKRTILLWFVLFLFLFHAYWLAMTNFVIPDFWDTQYSLKPGLLLQRVKEHPGHPLVLIMGSSRVEDGVRPGLLASTLDKPKTPLIFNFGYSGSDLFREYICLRRLLADGVKPQRVGIEFNGATLYHTLPLNIDDPRYFMRARRDEVDIFSSFVPQPGPLKKEWLRSRLDPTYKNGMVVPGQARMVRLIPLPFVWKFGESRPYDAWGWYSGVVGIPSDEEFSKRLEFTRKQLLDSIEEPKITASNDRSLRLMLDLCKKNGIDAFLLRMPESKEYQAFYPPGANQEMDEYLHAVCKEYNVPLIDARSWIDRKGFSDGHHLNYLGSEEFTKRLGQELLDTKPDGVTH